MLYLLLYLEFFKIGLFAVGGGMATVPFLTDLSNRTGWFSHEELVNMIAIAESTPGAIGVNTATYVGYATFGIPGGIIATLGLITPSVIVVIIVAKILASFRKNHYVEGIFYCLRPATLGLVLSAGLTVFSITFFSATSSFIGGMNLREVLLFIVLLVFMVFVPKTKTGHPFWFILCSALIGICIF